MKSFIATIAGLSLLTTIIAVLSLFTMPDTMPVTMSVGNVVLAASTSSVAATVTVQNISVSVTDGIVTYGTLGQNATSSTRSPADLQTATNDGNVAESFNIKGSTSTAWALGATAGSDIYVHKFCTSTCETPPTNYTALTLDYATLATNIASTSVATFDLFINTPNPSTVFTVQSVNVTVQAVAYP